MEELELISCQLIAAAGGAKSNYIEAIEASKNGKFDEAERLMKEGAQIYLTGHDAHLKLLQLSAEGNLNLPLLLIHAEDQMMNCETIKILAEQMIRTNRELCGLKEMHSA